MKPLIFNHAYGKTPKPDSLLLGLALLSGLVVLSGVYRQVTETNQTLEKQLEARQSVLVASANQPTKLVKVNPAQAVEIADAQLNIHTPWISLFQDLEHSQRPHIYWMQLSPDVKRKLIRMTVLASNRQQGWALIDRLKKQNGLTDVKIKASESSEVNGLVMTTLHVEAGWKF